MEGLGEIDTGGAPLLGGGVDQVFGRWENARCLQDLCEGDAGPFGYIRTSLLRRSTG